MGGTRGREISLGSGPMAPSNVPSPGGQGFLTKGDCNTPQRPWIVEEFPDRGIKSRLLGGEIARISAMEMGRKKLLGLFLFK